MRSIAIAVMLVAAVVAALFYGASWYERSNRHVVSAVVGTDGNLYVLLESHTERERFHLLRYEGEDSFEDASDISLQDLPGCGEDGVAVIEGIAAGSRELSLLGQCVWGSTNIVWSYSIEKEEFSVAANLEGPYVDAAVSLEDWSEYQVAYSEALEGKRYCGQLSALTDGSAHSLDFRGSLPDASVDSVSCPAGVWNMASGEDDGLVFLVRERESQLFSLCRVAGIDDEIACDPIAGQGLEDCQINIESSLVGCDEGTDAGDRYTIYSIGQEVTRASEGERRGTAAFILPLDESVVVEISASDVNVISY